MFIAAILASMATNIYALAAAFGGMGLGSGLLEIRSLSVSSQLFPDESRSFAISIAKIGTPLGSACFPILWRYLLGICQSVSLEKY